MQGRTICSSRTRRGDDIEGLEVIGYGLETHMGYRLVVIEFLKGYWLEVMGYRVFERLLVRGYGLERLGVWKIRGFRLKG